MQIEKKIIDTLNDDIYNQNLNNLKKNNKDNTEYIAYLEKKAYYDIAKFSIPDNLFETYLNYCMNPTIETAQELFKKIKLPIPLENIINLSSQEIDYFLKRKIIINQTNLNEGGGGSRRIGGGGQENHLPSITDIYKELVKLDFLHDFKNLPSFDENSREKLADFILQNIDIKNKKKIINDFKNYKNNTFLYSNYFINQANIENLLQNYDFKINKNKHENVNINIDSDATLFNIWLKWSNNIELNIILDGLFINYKYLQDPSKNGFNGFCGSMIQSAFILLLFNNAKFITDTYINTITVHINPKYKNKIKTVNLIDGIFNQIEETPPIHYFQIYCNNLKKICGFDKSGSINIKTIGVKYDPIYFIKYYKPNTIITKNSLNNSLIVKLNNNYTFSSISKPTNKIEKIIENISNHKPILNSYINLYYNKLELSEFISCLFDIIEKDPGSNTVKEFILTLIDLNFIRDCFRADVAIQNDYVFITKDRLAFTYYSIIVYKENKIHNGMFIQTPYEVDHIKNLGVIIGKPQQ